jgi:hypothetical protein
LPVEHYAAGSPRLRGFCDGRYPPHRATALLVGCLPLQNPLGSGPPPLHTSEIYIPLLLQPARYHTQIDNPHPPPSIYPAILQNPTTFLHILLNTQPPFQSSNFILNLYFLPNLTSLIPKSYQLSSSETTHTYISLLNTFTLLFLYYVNTLPLYHFLQTLLHILTSQTLPKILKSHTPILPPTLLSKSSKLVHTYFNIGNHSHQTLLHILLIPKQCSLYSFATSTAYLFPFCIQININHSHHRQLHTPINNVFLRNIQERLHTCTYFFY